MTTPRNLVTLQQKLRLARTLLREIARKDEAALKELLDAGVLDEIPPETAEFMNRSRAFLGMPLLGK
jgi:hypothetical protein